jgi:quercetin dioxygenase-like cupin family protein
MTRSSGLPPIRRLVTGHDDRGMAIVRSDDEFWTEDIPGGVASFALIWTTATVPADNNDEADGRSRDAALTIHSGSVIRVVDMLPGQTSPMHRTNSIDYGIVISGDLELELDDGSVSRLGPGSIIVQRGTMHLWRNPSNDRPCRVVFVLTQATPYRFNGEPLPEVQP